MPRKICQWTEIEPDAGVFNTCKEGEEFHLSPGFDLHPDCMWCGGKIVTSVERPESSPHGIARDAIRLPTETRAGAYKYCPKCGQRFNFENCRDAFHLGPKQRWLDIYAVKV